MRKCTIYKVSFSAISNLYLLNIGINDSKNTQVLATTAHNYITFNSEMPGSMNCLQKRIEMPAWQSEQFS